MVDAVELSLRYDGDEYSGEMSARELAGVLTAVSDYAQAVASTGLMGRNARVAGVKVQALRSGSFDIGMLMEVLGVARDAVEPVVLLGGSFAFYYRFMRRRVSAATHVPDRGVFQVTFTNGDMVEMTEAEWALFNNRRARRAVRGIVAPLKSGASRLDITAGQEQVSFDSEEAERFGMHWRSTTPRAVFNGTTSGRNRRPSTSTPNDLGGSPPETTPSRPGSKTRASCRT